jgi:hypothetical protein
MSDYEVGYGKPPAAKAVKGDIASAEMLLRMRAHAEKHGDPGPLVIRIINALPP